MSQLESPTCNLEVEEILSHHEFSNREYSYTRYKIRFSQIYEIMCYSPILLSIQGKKKCTLWQVPFKVSDKPNNFKIILHLIINYIGKNLYGFKCPLTRSTRIGNISLLHFRDEQTDRVIPKTLRIYLSYSNCLFESRLSFRRMNAFPREFESHLPNKHTRKCEGNQQAMGGKMRDTWKPVVHTINNIQFLKQIA